MCTTVPRSPRPWEERSVSGEALLMLPDSFSIPVPPSPSPRQRDRSSSLLLLFFGKSLSFLQEPRQGCQQSARLGPGVRGKPPRRCRGGCCRMVLLPALSPPGRGCVAAHQERGRVVPTRAEPLGKCTGCWWGCGVGRTPP